LYAIGAQNQNQIPLSISNNKLQFYNYKFTNRTMLKFHYIASKFNTEDDNNAKKCEWLQLID